MIYDTIISKLLYEKISSNYYSLHILFFKDEEI